MDDEKRLARSDGYRRILETQNLLKALLIAIEAQENGQAERSHIDVADALEGILFVLDCAENEIGKVV